MQYIINRFKKEQDEKTYRIYITEALKAIGEGRCYPAEEVFAELEQDLKNAERIFNKINSGGTNSAS